jgi:hypothetical protein
MLFAFAKIIISSFLFYALLHSIVLKPGRSTAIAGGRMGAYQSFFQFKSSGSASE